MHSGSRQTIQRDLFFGLSISALLFISALAWGSPFVNFNSATVSAQVDQQPGQPAQAQPQQAKTFSGTVQKNGSDFVLRDGAGQTFNLDDPANASSYEGKAVKVTGQLDERAMLIHVQRIESNQA
jgi:hypothetical protein